MKPTSGFNKGGFNVTMSQHEVTKSICPQLGARIVLTKTDVSPHVSDGKQELWYS